MENFFDNYHNEFFRFISKLQELTPNPKVDHYSDMNLLIKVVEKISNSSYSYSFNICTFNIEHIGQQFITRINDFQNLSDYNRLIPYILRFAVEFQMKNEYYDPDVAEFIFYYEKNINEYFAPNVEEQLDFNSQIYYAIKRMPYKVIEEITLKKLSNTTQIIEESLEKQLPNKKQEIENIKKDCNKYTKLLKGFKQEFSFLALNQAFNKLEKNKLLSKRITFSFLIILAIFIIYLPYTYIEKMFLVEELTKVFNLSLSGTKDNMPLFILLGSLVPMVFIESMLIYYFKIILNKYNSITDQIVQLETKQAIMQFIESYVDYKKNKNLKNEDLAKFEDIIFSQISPNLKDVPSSPDLMSLVENISKAIKKG